MKVYVIHGSPLSGKSTYVDKCKGDNDLVYDYDLLMSAISGKPVHAYNKNLIQYVLAIRDLLITKLKSESLISTAWIITTNINNDLRESLAELNPVYIEIQIDIQEAKQRLKSNPGNRNVKIWEEAIDKYFIKPNNYFITCKSKDYSKFYTTKEWRRKRIIILKRDNFQCQEAKRYGRVEEANIVHHIIPIKDRPDLKLDSRNLTSLTEIMHNKMHKIDGSLSKLGEELKDRMLRKYPGLLQAQ